MFIASMRFVVPLDLSKQRHDGTLWNFTEILSATVVDLLNVLDDCTVSFETVRALKRKPGKLGY